MAEYSYRIHTETQWMASSGSGIIAIVNKAGSGRKLRIKSFEVYNYTRMSSMRTVDTLAPFATNLCGYYCTALGDGDTITPVAYDTSNTWPSGAVIRKCGGFTVDTARTPVAAPLFRVPVIKSSNFSTATMGSRLYGSPKLATGAVWSKLPNTDIAYPTIEAGAKFCIGFDISYIAMSIPVIISAVLRVGTNTFTVTYFTNVRSEVDTPFSIDNQSASAIEIVSLEVTEIGTYDTPYFQLVPISIVHGDAYTDATRKLAPFPMDTSTPSFTDSVGNVFVNVPVYPAQGIPFEYLAAGSAGSPKGTNYFHAKDFVGPVYATFLPEHAGLMGSGASAVPIPRNLGIHNSMLGSNLIRVGDSTEIVLAEGEGIALVSGAESATAFVGASGWMHFEFGITFVSAPTLQPQLTLTGLPEGAEVRITQGSFTLATSGYVSGGSYSYLYDYNGDTTVTVSVNLPGHDPTVFNWVLTNSVTSLPISLSPSPSYI